MFIDIYPDDQKPRQSKFKCKSFEIWNCSSQVSKACFSVNEIKRKETP